VSLVFVLAVVCMSVQPAAAYYVYYQNDSTNYNFYTLNPADHYTLIGASSDTGILKAKGSNTCYDGVYTVFEEVGMTFQPSENGRCKVGAEWQADYHIWVGWCGWNGYGVASITVKYVLYRGTTFLESRTVFTRTANADQQSISGTDSRDESTLVSIFNKPFYIILLYSGGSA
jgi:hypothetical protein